MDHDFRMLKCMVTEQQAQIKVLSNLCNYLVQAHFAFRERHAELLEQHRALCGCLIRKGSIEQADFLTQVRVLRSVRSLCRVLGEPRSACAIVLCAGFSAAHTLLMASSTCMGDIVRALSEVAKAYSRLERAEREECVPVCCVPVCCAAEWGFIALLQDIWQYNVLADTVSCAMGIATVKQFRAVSRAGRECMRSVFARIMLWEPSLAGMMALNMGLDTAACLPVATQPCLEPGPGVGAGEVEAPAPGSCLALLQDIWQYTMLAEELTWAMGSASVQQFRAVSRSCCECMRCASTWKLLPHCVMGLAPRTPLLRSPGAADPPDPPDPPDIDHSKLVEALKQDASCRTRRAAFSDSLRVRTAHNIPDVGASFQKIVSQLRGRPSVRLPVKLCGLRERSDLNGAVGTLVECASPDDRWKVVLSTGVSIRVRPAHLEFMRPEMVEIIHQRITEQRMALPGSAVGSLVPTTATLSGPTAAARRSGQPQKGPGEACGSLALCASGVGRFAGTVAVSSLAALSRPVLEQMGATGRLYVCGGSNNGQVLTSVECLDLTTGIWQAAPRMARAREGASVVATGGRVYICGGSDGKGWLNSMERFDPRSQGWEVMPPMSMPRISACTCAINGRIYVCGGQFHVALCSLERFDPATRSWQMLEPMSQKRASPMALVIGSCLHVFGGMAEDLTFLDSAEVFDTMEETWRMSPPMLQRRCHAAVAHTRGCAYVAGGFDGIELRKAECFHVESQRWVQLPTMIHARCGAVAAMAQQRRVFVCGGCGLSGVFAEAYDITAGAWEALRPPGAQGRCFGAVAAIANHVYVCGGGGDQDLCNVERLNLRNGTWEVMEPLPFSRARASGFYSLFS